MTLKFELFPQPIIDLAQEVHNHPELLQLLDEQEAPDFSEAALGSSLRDVDHKGEKKEGKDIYVQMLAIASYCGIVVEGSYDINDMVNLAGILVKKLYERRTQIVLL
jgi:hypothetical protein